MRLLLCCGWWRNKSSAPIEEILKKEVFHITEDSYIYTEWRLDKFWLFGKWIEGKNIGPQTIEVRHGFFEDYKTQLDKIFGVYRLDKQQKPICVPISYERIS